MTKNLYCIVGPSGSGKSTLAARLAANGYSEARSHTTRKCRGGDDIWSYNFVTDERFQAMICDGEMLEYVEYAGNYYGTTYTSLMVCDFILVELQGVKNFREKYSDRPIKVIGLDASPEELKRRLSERTDDSAARVEDDKHRFWNLQRQVDCYINGKSIDETVWAALNFIQLCEGVS